jgi:hypothetical protein
MVSKVLESQILNEPSSEAETKRVRSEEYCKDLMDSRCPLRVVYNRSLL